MSGEPSDALLRVLLAAGDVWGPRQVADVAARLADVREAKDKPDEPGMLALHRPGEGT